VLVTWDGKLAWVAQRRLPLVIVMTPNLYVAGAAVAVRVCKLYPADPCLTLLGLAAGPHLHRAGPVPTRRKGSSATPVHAPC
jgi:hypothetical protein